MSGEVETAGAAITAGLVAAAVDSPKPRGDAVQGVCANCSSQLAGKYCAACGQPANIHRTLGHMASEFLHGLFHLDTRAWRTLPLLLFRPGTLTHSYIHGQRARFISPLAMFLLSVFTMFVVFGFTGGARIGVPDPERRAAALEEASGEAGDARRQIEQALATRGADTSDAAAEEIDDFHPSDASIYDEIRKSAQSGDLAVNTGSPAFDAKLKEKLLNPELAIYKIQNAAYENAFLLVPISLPLVWLMFAWRRGTTLFDHTVYILYSLSFVSLLFIAISLLSMIPGAMSVLGLPLLLAGLMHSFFHLKGGYGLSWFSALWRLPFQLAFAAIGATVFLVAIIVVGLAG
jgi:hypothetical protein